MTFVAVFMLLSMIGLPSSVFAQSYNSIMLQNMLSNAEDQLLTMLAVVNQKPQSYTEETCITSVSESIFGSNLNNPYDSVNQKQLIDYVRCSIVTARRNDEVIIDMIDDFNDDINDLESDINNIDQINNISDIGDVSFSSLSNGELLQFNGSDWTNVSTSSLGIGGGGSYTAGTGLSLTGSEFSVASNVLLDSDSTDDLSEGSTNLYSQWGENGTSIFYNGGNVGIGTSTPAAALHIVGGIIGNSDGSSSDDFVFGSPTTNYTGSTAQASRMFFDTDLSAFRAGYATNTDWNTTNTGTYSAAFGQGTVASATSSSAFGIGTTASGIFSFAAGLDSAATQAGSVAFGNGTQVTGAWSFGSGTGINVSGGQAVAFGSGATASGFGSTALGVGVTASEFASVALGSGSAASGNTSVAFGDTSTASGFASTAFGSNSTASGGQSIAGGSGASAEAFAAVAFGSNTTASGEQSAAFGSGASAENFADTAFGTDTTANSGGGGGATAMGSQTTASAFASTAFGSSATASGSFSTAFGAGTQATSSGATAFGQGSIAGGESSTAFGNGTQASAVGATAFGSNTKASGQFSRASGIFTTASGDISNAFGQGIEAAGTYAFAVALDGGQTGVSFGTSTAAFMGGDVGVGTATPQRTLHVLTSADEAPVRFEDSNGYCEIDPTSATWNCTSDERLKKNISSLDNEDILNRLSQLRPVNFVWRSDSSEAEQTGLIAQEVEDVFPSLVKTDEKSGYKSVSYGGFIPRILSGLQGLSDRVSSLFDGSGRIDVRETRTDKLCVGDTCVTESEFKQLLDEESADESDTSGLQSLERRGGNTDSGEAEEEDDTSSSTTTATTTDETSDESEIDTSSSTPDTDDKDEGNVATTTDSSDTSGNTAASSTTKTASSSDSVN